MTVQLYGIHPVLEALKKRPRAVKGITLSRRAGKTIDPILKLASGANIDIRYTGPDQITAIAGSENHQGVAAEAEPYGLTELDLLVSTVGSKDRKAFILVLDSIQDPQNFGALIRSALCSGVQAVVFPKDRSAGLNGATAKASAGAIEHMTFCRVTNICAALDYLKKAGVWVAGTFADGRDSLYAVDLNIDLALVMGNEEKGIRPLVKKNCDFLLSIPLEGRFDSLNAAMAGAVVMFEVMRQRTKQRG